MTVYPPIEIHSIRTEFLGAPFPGTELPDLLTAASQAQRWIDLGKREIGGGASRWLAWPDRPEFEPFYGSLSLNTGAAGIAWHALTAADVTGDPAHLERARRAATYVAEAWRDHIDDAPFDLPGVGLAYYGGLAGIGATFLEIGSRFDEFAVVAPEIFDEILTRVQASGPRAGGWTPTSAVLGDGGIVMSLVDAARALGDARYLDAAVRAGELALGDESSDADGPYWPGTDVAVFGMPGGLELQGFEPGGIGTAYVLGKLAAATGDERFAQASKRASLRTLQTATVVGDSALIARHGGGYFFGYCTGSAGVIRSLVQVHHAAGDEESLEWALKFGRGILRSGVPGRQTPTNQYVFHQCCGSAAIVEAFVGLWLETRDPLWLEAANAQADELLARSTFDEKGRRWYSEVERLPTGTLKAEVGHQVGASGIAVALLRLHAANELSAGRQGFPTPRLPDDPFVAS